ncbi:MAG: hypothetical protein ACP5IG_03185 [Candidatus Micrarchaeia archaeon]
MAGSVSDAVREIVSEMSFLALPFKYDLINFSALGRLIQPLVEKRVGGPVSLDAVVMAVRRLRLQESLKEDQGVKKFAGQCKLVLRADFFVLNLKPRPELYSALLDFEKQVNWAIGEKMYLLLRSDEITVIGMSKFVSKVMALVNDLDVLDFYNNIVLLTVYFGPEAQTVSGLLSIFADQLAYSNTPVIASFHTRSRISFALRESDATRAYDWLSRALRSYATTP